MSLSRACHLLSSSSSPLGQVFMTRRRRSASRYSLFCGVMILQETLADPSSWIQTEVGAVIVGEDMRGRKDLK